VQMKTYAVLSIVLHSNVDAFVDMDIFERQLALYLSNSPVLEGFRSRLLTIETINDSITMAKFFQKYAVSNAFNLPLPHPNPPARAVNSNIGVCRPKTMKNRSTRRNTTMYLLFEISSSLATVLDSTCIP
jgi:hypothetical protein